MGSSPPPRKILIMTYNDEYLNSLSKIILKTPIKIDNEIGFAHMTLPRKNMIITFLSCAMRKVWIHHFTGTKANIIIYEGDDVTERNTEIISMLSNEKLKKTPSLILLDKNKIDNDNEYKKRMGLEQLRQEMSKRRLSYNVMEVDFDDISSKSEVLYGIEWIEKEIKVIS